MADRPLKDGQPNYPEWASEDVQDDLNKEYNKYEPPEQKKKIGWERGESPPRQWMNYNADLIYKWIKYLDEKTKDL